MLKLRLKRDTYSGYAAHIDALLPFVAPLVGVPLMVALLSLTSPKETAPVGEADTGVRAEQAEPQVVHPAELEAEYVLVLFDAGVIGVGPEGELIGAKGRLRSTRRHKPSPEHFKYHRMIHGLQD